MTESTLAGNPELILDIYQSYLDVGCSYLTTCNYGYKSLKLDNWEFLVNRAVNIMNTVKDEISWEKNKNTNNKTILKVIIVEKWMLNFQNLYKI